MKLYLKYIKYMILKIYLKYTQNMPLYRSKLKKYLLISSASSNIQSYMLLNVHYTPKMCIITDPNVFGHHPYSSVNISNG